MRIGILSLCIGQYQFFWKDFYLSAEQYLFQGDSLTREYYVFTDSPSLYGEDENPHIHRIYQEDMGWPDNTMMRFQLFLGIENELRDKTDYLYFFNANAQFMEPLGNELLPSVENNDLVGSLTPYVYGRRKWNYSYERRHESACYIPYWKGTYYFSGAVNGGSTCAFLSLCYTCNTWLKQDKQKGIIPKFHDESAINRYFLNNPPKVLDYSYCWADDKDSLRHLPLKKACKILMRNKLNYFSLETLGRSNYGENKEAFHETLFEKLSLRLLNRWFGYYKKRIQCE